MPMVHFDAPKGEFIHPERLMKWMRERPIKNINSAGEITRERIVPLCLWGAAGTGKTQIIRKFCEDNDLEMRTYHSAHDASGSDIVGIPARDPETGRTTYSIPTFLPVEGDPPGVLFFDELNRGTKEVLQGLMEPLGEGTISQSGWSLPDNWQIICAANPGETGYDVAVLDDAMIDRMLHYVPGWDAPAWARWATRSGLHPTVIDFTLARRNMLRIEEAMMPIEVAERLGATPRAMEYISALVEDGMSEGMLNVIALGLLGRQAGPQFVKDFTSGADEHPLTARAIQDGAEAVYRRVLAWKHANNVDLIMGSALHMMGSLVGRSPVLPQDKDEISQMGRFMALLEDFTREEIVAEMERSAPAWVDPLQSATDHWVSVLQLSSSPALRR